MSAVEAELLYTWLIQCVVAASDLSPLPFVFRGIGPIRIMIRSLNELVEPSIRKRLPR